MHRRGFLAGFGATITVGPSGYSGATDAFDSRQTDAAVPETVALETLATGFEIPLDVAFAPDGDRLYVVQRGGVVSVVESGERREEPFLDLTEEIVVGAETGLLGVALHPDFARNRRVFVRYSAPPRDGTPSNFSHTFVLAEFTASADGRRADPGSERTLLEIPEPGAYHNAGSLAFGPDGYLYVGVGDGGGSGDDRERGTAEDWYDAIGGGNGQDVAENLLGSVLRIDVDREGDDRPYAVPEDNPFANGGDTAGEGLPEHYAWGFRNPWRMSFDRGDLFVGDVGRNRYEEVDLVEKGGNYGWNVREGTHCHRAETCPDETPDSVRGGEPLVDPIVEYPHDTVESDAAVRGNSVVGGCVYRGSALPELRGRYVFADLDAGGLGRDVGGELFVATRPGDTGPWPTQVVEAVGDDDALGRIFAFGRDDRGEVYVLGEGSETGRLHRIVPDD